jgi:hypothetical protein
MKRQTSTAHCCTFGREKVSLEHPICISCQRQDVPCPFSLSTPSRVDAPLAEKKIASKAKQPNKTEMECGHRLRLEFPGAEVRYEPIALMIDLDGERFGYRPDWGVIFPDGRILLVEVKNAGYQHASYGRSKLAFAAARVRWPMFSWRWAEKQSGNWLVRDY